MSQNSQKSNKDSKEAAESMKVTGTGAEATETDMTIR
jgi:hypothetical protein